MSDVCFDIISCTSISVGMFLDTWVTGWCLSTTTELMGGATPMTCRAAGGRPTRLCSGRPVKRAVTVLKAFCLPAVTIRVLA